VDEKYKQNKRWQESGVAAWETIYCSLILILVALFAMLASYSKTETRKIEHFLQRRIFLEDPDISAALSIKSLKRYFKEAGMSTVPNIEKVKDGFKASYESRTFFAPGLAVANKEAYPVLDKMIELANKFKLKIRVEGHTDNIPINTAQFPSNWELSASRAANVLQYFLNKGKLPTEMLSTAGLAHYHPIESNDTPEGREKNRRVVFYFRLTN